MEGMIQRVFSRFAAKSSGGSVDPAFVTVGISDFESLSPFYDPNLLHEGNPTQSGQNVKFYFKNDNASRNVPNSGLTYQLKHLPGFIDNGKFGYYYKVEIVNIVGGVWHVSYGVCFGVPTSWRGTYAGVINASNGASKNAISGNFEGASILQGVALSVAAYPNQTYKGSWVPGGNAQTSYGKAGNTLWKQDFDAADYNNLELSVSNVSVNVAAPSKPLIFIGSDAFGGIAHYQTEARIQRALIRIAP